MATKHPLHKPRFKSYGSGKRGQSLRGLLSQRRRGGVIRRAGIGKFPTVTKPRLRAHKMRRR